MVAFSCLRFLHTAEVAYVMRSLFMQIKYERVQEGKMESNMFYHAILYEKDFSGMGLDDLFAQESLPGTTTFVNVFFMLDTMKGVPIFFVESITLDIPSKGRCRIKSIKFDANMLTKVLDNMCDRMPYPVWMAHEDKIIAALSSYSMAFVDRFTGKEALGLFSNQAWFVYELTLGEHSFVAYMLSVLLAEAEHLDEIAIVSDLFAPFSRVEGATFAFPKTGIVFPIHDIIQQVAGAQFEVIDVETREEQLHWVTAVLEHLMQVPVLGLDELPKIANIPPEVAVSPIALTPIGALLEDVSGWVNFTPPPLRRELFPKEPKTEELEE